MMNTKEKSFSLSVCVLVSRVKRVYKRNGPIMSVSKFYVRPTQSTCHKWMMVHFLKQSFYIYTYIFTKSTNGL